MTNTDQEIQEFEKVFTELKEMLHLSDEVLIRINDKFFESIPLTIEKIEEAIGAEEYEAIKSYSHSVKGGASSLRYFAISEIAEEIEKNAQNKESYPYKEKLDQLSAEFNAAAHRYSLWKNKKESR